MKYTNFQDIPQRLRAYYCVDVDFRSIEQILTRYEQDYHLQLNPDFQRGHVWTEEQQIAYIEYLLTNPDRDKSTSIIFNMPGWQNLDYCPGAYMVCVDGLQRLTACRRFLNNEIPAYGTYFKDYSGCMHGGLQFVVGAFRKKSSVLQWYLQINAKGTPHTDEEIARVREMLRQERTKADGSNN